MNNKKITSLIKGVKKDDFIIIGELTGLEAVQFFTQPNNNNNSKNIDKFNIKGVD